MEEKKDIEGVSPQRIDETKRNYRERTFLHQDQESSQARSLLVETRIRFGTGIDLDKLSQREKVNLTNYYLQNSREHHWPLIDFTKKFGINGLRTFISCEYGMKIGDTILELGQKLPPETARKIFAKYAEIVDISEQTLEYLEKGQTGEDNLSPQTIATIKESLLSSAKDFLLKLSRSSEKGKEKEILDELAHKKADLLLLAAVYRQTKFEKEKFPNLDFEQGIKSSDLRDEDKKKILDLARFNYRETPDFAQKIVLPLLEDGLKNEETYFYILRKDNEIVAFVRFEPKADGDYYIGSFNVDENAQGAGIGQTFFKEVIKREGKNKRLVANVELNKPIASFYLNKIGFIATEITPNVEGTGLAGLKIVYDHEKKDSYRRPLAERSFTEEELVLELTEKLNSGQFVLTHLDRDPKTGKYFVSLEPKTEEAKRELAA